jgi:radical SAM superfamily enzyme YgiQ (UPF0313 family)/Flp pilus assembly protein TadD
MNSSPPSEAPTRILTIEQALQLAITHHQAGQLREAERLYRSIIQTQPNHPDANHNLGVLAVQELQPASGLPHFEIALEANQDREQYWLSYIEALIQAGQTKKARQVLERGRQRGLRGSAVKTIERRLISKPVAGQRKKAVKTRQISVAGNTFPLRSPTDQEMNALVVLFNQGLYGEAELLARKMTVRFPQLGFGWKALGSVLQLQGRYFESLDPKQKAAVLLPNDPETHNNLGNTLQELGRLDEAEGYYRRALEIRPDFAEARNNLGNTLLMLGRLEEAEACYRLALQFAPLLAEAQSNLGNTLLKLDRLDEAEAFCRQALSIRPDFSDAHGHLGAILQKLNRPEEALASYRLSLSSLGNWESAIHRLTSPLVSLTGITMGGLSGAKHEEASDGPATAPNDHQTSKTMPTLLPNRQTRSSREAMHPNSVKSNKLRIVLIYPPPWRIPPPRDVSSGMPFGPPRGGHGSSLTGDFKTIPFGLLSIAAQAMRAGHDVRVFNLSVCSWEEVVTTIAQTKADVYGISAFTANRRGMGAVAELIRRLHPQAHITAGGPFVSALPLDTLKYYSSIDTAVIGEGEGTFLELLERLGSKHSTTGIAGTAWRNGTEIKVEPRRQRINDLDTLASSFDHFSSHIVMTSRGCPGKCSFCGSFTTWGKELRFHSVEFCLTTFKKALDRLSVPFLAIKDDTFTADRNRAVAICDEIINSKLNFLWSCDTRVDSVDDALLRKMRLAGCQMISLGVESGAPEILKSMNKKISPEMVLNVTRSAQKYGMHVRYYMIFLNRGETPHTLEQSIELIKNGRPNRFFFSPLSFYPGTKDWEMLSKEQGLTSDIFFTNDFSELTVSINRQRAVNRAWAKIVCDIGAIDGFDYTVAEREEIARQLPSLHVVHIELAHAYYRAGRLDEATLELARAKELKFPIRNILSNQHACIALARGEIDNALAILSRAIQVNNDNVVAANMRTARLLANGSLNKQSALQRLNDSVQAIDYIKTTIDEKPRQGTLPEQADTASGHV